MTAWEEWVVPEDEQVSQADFDRLQARAVAPHIAERERRDAELKRRLDAWHEAYPSHLAPPRGEVGKTVAYFRSDDGREGRVVEDDWDGDGNPGPHYRVGWEDEG